MKLKLKGKEWFALEFLTVKEASRVLRVSENTIRAWLKEGKLPGVRFGRVFRIPKEALVNSRKREGSD